MIKAGKYGKVLCIVFSKTIESDQLIHWLRPLSEEASKLTVKELTELGFGIVAVKVTESDEPIYWVYFLSEEGPEYTVKQLIELGFKSEDTLERS